MPHDLNMGSNGSEKVVNLAEWKVKKSTSEAIAYTQIKTKLPKEIYIRGSEIDFIKSMSKFGYTAYPAGGPWVVLKQGPWGPDVVGDF